MSRNVGSRSTESRSSNSHAVPDLETLRINCEASVRRVGQIITLIHRWRQSTDPIWHDAAGQVEDALRLHADEVPGAGVLEV